MYVFRVSASDMGTTHVTRDYQPKKQVFAPKAPFVEVSFMISRGETVCSALIFITLSFNIPFRSPDVSSFMSWDIIIFWGDLRSLWSPFLLDPATETAPG